MKPEKRQLLHDLLDGQRDARRIATLSAGGRVLRRRRWRRAAFQGFTAVVGLALAALAIQRLALPPAPIQMSLTPPPARPQGLSDAELLSLFPDTPVGLITLHDGKKRLVFPRPGDEERFVRRL